MNGTIYMPVGEVCSSISDTYREKKNMVTLINTSDVLEGRVLNHERVPNSNLKGQFKKTFQRDDILYSEIRPQNRRFAYVDFSPIDYIASTKLMVIRAKKDVVSPKYLYYFLKNSSTVAELQLLAETRSGTFPQITFSEVANLTIPVPSLAVQEVIVQTMQCLEDKITCNEQINDNLYAQAKATTKQWISKSTGDYELLPLSDIASINPDTYSPKETWKYVNYLDTSSITEGCIAEIQHITPSSEKLPSRARRKIAPNDIVFSTVRPNQRHYGIISEPLPNMLGSTGFAVIRSKNPLVCNELIYLCLTENEFIEKMQQLAEQSTSTFPSIKPSDLGVCEIPCPKDQSSTSFTETLKSLFALIAANQRENISLSEIRDVLLPKLMSGEIDVSDIQL